jgi:hypothetical protein
VLPCELHTNGAGARFVSINHVAKSLARPAGLEPATSWFVVRVWKVNRHPLMMMKIRRLSELRSTADRGSISVNVPSTRSYGRRRSAPLPGPISLPSPAHYSSRDGATGWRPRRRAPRLDGSGNTVTSIASSLSSPDDLRSTRIATKIGERFERADLGPVHGDPVHLYVVTRRTS